MRDRICIACGRRLPKEPLLQLENMPSSAQNIPDKEQIKEDKGISLSLCRCAACGLVQFDCEPVDYYRDVIRSGGYSTTMVNLRRRQYRHLIDTWHLEGKRFLEAGCGQGEFLSVLRGFPVEVFGIEHRQPLVDMAKEKGLNVWRQFTENEDTVIEGPQDNQKGPYDVFLSFNFLEHQPEPVKMLKCIYNNLSEDGMGLVTVPSLEYILNYDGYYELIRDHLAYYTFETLEYVLGLAGFQVLEREMVNRDTLSVVVKKMPADWRMTDSHREETAEREPAENTGDFGGLKASEETIQRETLNLIQELHQNGERLAVWGASHQGFTLASTTGLGDKVSYMIDSAPFKQNRFAPASHIPIVPPDYYFKEPVEAILIVAPGYTEEISGIIRERFGGQVKQFTLRSSHIERLSV